MRVCTKCKIARPEVQYFWRIKNVKRANQCKFCHKQYRDSHYQENKQKRIKQARILKQKKRSELNKIVIDFLKNHPCIDCGESDIIKLEFDHLHSKEDEVTKMVHRCVSQDKLLKEIGKCEVRCANCHRVKTAKQFGWRRWIELLDTQAVSKTVV